MYIDSTTAAPRNDTGRQTSAQWIRVAFGELHLLSHSGLCLHMALYLWRIRPSGSANRGSDDFLTADVATGRGGLDALITFETHHPENVGPAFNDSLFFFQFFFSERASSKLPTLRSRQE